jgi:CheY-like chemotaxis protein
MAEAYRVVVVEDDADVAFYTKTVLEKRGGCVVETVSDPSLARAVISEFLPDVVVTDIEMPGINGLELMEQIRTDHPGIPIVVMTAHISVDYAVGALNAQADEFLIKPISASDLVTAVMRLAADGRASRSDQGDRKRESVLAIGAHPDDVEFGIGGLLAAHRAAGDSVTILTLSRGTSTGQHTDLQHESLAAAEILEARLFLEDLPVNAIGNGTAAAATTTTPIAAPRTKRHWPRHPECPPSPPSRASRPPSTSAPPSSSRSTATPTPSWHSSAASPGERASAPTSTPSSFSRRPVTGAGSVAARASNPSRRFAKRPPPPARQCR